MLEIITGIIFATVAFVLAEKDKKDSDLYKLLHKKKEKVK
jgi:hypothetical protein